jgi:hypothetical protein
MGSKATYPSRVHTSVLSFHLGKHCLGHHHLYPIKMVHECVQIVFPILSSTPNQLLPFLVSLPIRLPAAQPPILSNHRFKIDAVPSNYASNIEWGKRGGEGCHWQGRMTMGRAGHHHDVWL